VHDEFKSQLTKTDFNKEGSIKLTEYLPNKLVYQSNSQSDQFAVFSEIWYGPDKGWTATIDGVDASILRANYILRGINIPAGKHEIVMEFKPSSNVIGYTISWICGLILLLGFAYYFYSTRKPSTVNHDD